MNDISKINNKKIKLLVGVKFKETFSSIDGVRSA